MSIANVQMQLFLASINLTLVVVNLASRDYGWATFSYIAMLLCLFEAGRNK